MLGADVARQRLRIPIRNTLQVSSVQDAEHGTVRMLEDGSIQFVPDENYSGPASFTCTVVDEAGATSTARVDLQVAAVADAAIIEAADVRGLETKRSRSTSRKECPRSQCNDTKTPIYPMAFMGELISLDASCNHNVPSLWPIARGGFLGEGWIRSPFRDRV
ncbi:MAG: cadherin-like domain-containing protein [Pirellulaceae bacterium]